jgi:predicted choloylglycine hydrolase
VTLEGTPHERGLTHGKTLKDQIHELMKRWKADLTERYKMDADAFIKRFLKHTDFPAAIKKWTPDLLDEVNGIAQGAAVDVDSILVFQLIDEYWVNGPGIAGEHCSALGVARNGDRPSMIAQNMDLEGFRDGFQAVLCIRYPKSKREALVLTHAGLIALNGLNNRALGICCNTLTQLANCRDGLPVACVVRGVLQQESEEAALDFLHKIKHASGQNYILGGPNRVYALECSAGKVSRFTPAAGADRVWHTNHPLVNDDFNAAYRETLAKKENTKKEENSVLRLQSLQKRLSQEKAVMDLIAIKAALTARDVADHPVCRPYKNPKSNFTFASTIMVLADKPALHVAPGPPDVHPYQLLKCST